MRAAAVLLTLALLVGSGLVWIGAPPSDLSFATWFGLPALAVVAVAGLAALKNVLERKPGWMAVPDKRAFDLLSENRRREAVRSSRTLLDWVALEIALIASLIQRSMYIQRPGEALSPLLIAVLAFACIVSPAFIMLHVGRIQSTTKRLIREQQHAERSSNAG